MDVTIRGDGLSVMTETGELRHSDRNRELVLEAAVAELAANRLDRFTVEKVSARAGVDVLAVKQMWPNAPELLTAALIAFGERGTPTRYGWPICSGPACVCRCSCTTARSTMRTVSSWWTPSSTESGPGTDMIPADRDTVKRCRQLSWWWWARGSSASP